jgi:translation initiation factor IF-2
MRVFELSKRLGITSKDLIEALKKEGIRVAGAMAALDEGAVSLMTDRLAKKTQAKTVEPADRRAKVLIKKKAQPEPPPPPLVEEPKAKPKPAAPVEPKIEPKPTTVPAPPEPAVASVASTPAQSRVEPPPAPSAPPMTHPSTLAVPSKPLPAAVPSAPSVKPLTVEDKRKLLKTDLFEVAKREVSDRLKERLKKGKKVKKAKEATPFDYRSEMTAWHEIQPMAPSRRDRSRASHAAPAPSAASVAEVTKPRKKVIKLPVGITVKEFAEQVGLKATDVVKKLMEMGTLAGFNQPMDLNAAVLIAEVAGIKVEPVTELTEEDLLQEETIEEKETARLPRSPVVTIMGHVDHGKTTLLDAIRKTKVAAGEAGGITQHIGAYGVKVNDRRVVFLDTPGHEAFTAMRARGAKVTDIVVLVVAADDGVMPQTIEAINHAKAANVPIIVAVNKIDKPEANPERVKRALSEHGLVPEVWGGQTIFAEVSAKKGTGLDHLLELILLQADVMELKADPARSARGIIIEAKLDRGRGPVATVLVQDGTLRIGDVFVTGAFYGRVRSLVDDNGKKTDEAGPTTPVEVIGLPGVPMAGDGFQVLKDEQSAREIAAGRQQRQRLAQLASIHRVTLDDLYAQIKAGEVKELNLVIKADVQGSAEALKEALTKLTAEKVKLRVIHDSVGGITETDVLLASASNAIIIGFNIRPEPKAAALADREKVDIRLYTVIYDAVENIKAAMEGMLEPKLEERVLGRAEVRQTFNIVKVGTVAGCYVTDGLISRTASGVRVIRDHVPVYSGKLSSLKRFKDDVREVQTGYECGISIENFRDIKVGDILEAYVIEKVAPKA